MEETAISDRFRECLNLFADVSSVLLSKFEDTSQNSVYDSLSRFKLWAGNIGAHQRSMRSSLDYRLRDAPHLRRSVLDCLLDLKDVLSRGQY
jgi:hypothetical protein